MNTTSRKGSMTLALGCGIIGNIIWGTSYLFTRIAQQEAPPMVQMSLRFLLAFLLLNLMILFGWEKINLRGKNLKPLIILSCVEPIYFFFESYGIYYSNSTFSGVTLAIVPVIAIGMGTLILKEYPTRKQLFLCFLPIAGVILVTIAGSGMGAVQPIGVVLVLGACLFAAFYRVFNKDSSAEFTAFERSYFVIGMCMLAFTAVALCMVSGDLTPFVEALRSKRFVLSTLALSVFCSVAANILVNYSASVLPMTIFSNLGSLITVCAMFLGIIFLDEPTNAMSLVGSAMVLVGLFLIARTSGETVQKAEKKSLQKPNSR
mgnify:FL=1